MTAQSPSAQTPGQSGTSIYSFTTNRPRSFWHGSVSRRGLGEVPAVQTSVFVRIYQNLYPSLSQFLLSVLTQLVAELRQNYRSGMNQDNTDIFLCKVPVETGGFPQEIVGGRHRFDACEAS